MAKPTAPPAPSAATVKRAMRAKEKAVAVLGDGTHVTFTKPKGGGGTGAHVPKGGGIERLSPQFRAAMWKPGQSGNPGGRPKRKAISEAYRELINSTAPCSLPGYEHMTWAQAIAFSMAVEAVLGGNVGGSVSAAKEMRETLEGASAAADDARVPSIIINFGKEDEPIDDEEEPDAQTTA